MAEHIELTEEQKQFIRERFVGGEELFDRVERFEDWVKRVDLVISTKSCSGIVPDIGYYKDICWLNAYPEHLKIEFQKEVKR